VPRRHADGQRQQGQEQEPLGARERGEPDQRAERERERRPGILPQPQGDQQPDAHEQPVERLAHQRAVGGHERRVHGRDGRGDQTDPLPAHPPPEQPDHDDRERTQHAAREPVRLEPGPAEERRDRQDEGPQRRMLRARRGDPLDIEERMDEALAVGQEVRLPVVEEEVADPRGVLGDQERVGHPHDQPGGGDARQA